MSDATYSDTWALDHLYACQQKQSLTAPNWFCEWRKQSLDTFAQQGFPTRHNERWKYTRLHALSMQDFIIDALATSQIDMAPYLLDGCYHVVLLDGHLQQAYLPKELPAGVVICDLATAVRDYPEYYQHYLQRSALTPFAALAAGLSQQGVFIYLSANTQLTKPIQLLHVNSRLSADHMLNFNHVVVLQEQAELTLIDEFHGTAENYFNNALMNIEVCAHAKLQHYKIQYESPAAYHIAATRITQQTNSSVMNYNLSLGSQLARDDLVVELQGQDSECQLLGLCQLQGQQHVDHQTSISHVNNHTQSLQHYRSVVADRAHSVFNGKVLVQPDAKQCSAHQLNKNLLLSATAAADTKPELEIFNDDVSCSHGATVGELDQRALFYLRSRGIADAQARQLLIYAFAAELLDRLPDYLFTRQIRQVLAQRFPGIEDMAHA